MIWIIGLANLAGGVGLRLLPGTNGWWATRPLWMAVYLIGLVLVLALFGRYERLAAPRPGADLPAWRGLVGAALVCFGLALIAMNGIGGAGFLGLNWVPLLAAFVGAALLGISPWPRRAVS
jgi:hypothetical protein